MTNNYQLLKLHGVVDLETFLTIRYDNHGRAVHTHDPNQKIRIPKGGWTTWFVRVKQK